MAIREETDTAILPHNNDIDSLSQKVNLLLDAVIHTSNEALLLLDNDGHILMLNEKARDVFRDEKDQLRGMSFGELLPPTTRDRFINLLKHFAVSAPEGTTPVENMELAAVGLQKSAFLMELGLTICNLSGECFFIATIKDIVEKRRTEVEITMLAHAMMSISECLCITDLEGSIIFSNKAFQKSFQFNKKELKNVNFDHLCQRPEKFAQEIRPRTLKSGKWEGEIRCRTKEGRLFPFSLSTSTINDDQGTPALVIIVGKDITERKQLEEQLRQSQKMEAVGQLAGGVAHDFNNLLIVISGYADNLLKTTLEEDPQRKKILQISKAAERAAALTRQLLAFSRKQILQPQKVDINLLISDLEKMLRRLIGENIELKTNLDPNTSKIVADPGQIEQVLMNLVVNARDAMPNGGKLIIETANGVLTEEESRMHKGSQPGNYVFLTIRDNGCGMDNTTIARIFEPFFTTKDQGKGTGLGLSTVYGIVKQSNGYIMVDSDPGKGTVFKILMPRVVDEVQSRQHPVTENNEQNAQTAVDGNETILVVEDEEQVRELVCEMLESFGYRIIEADNGKDAIDIYNRNRDSIKLILTDVIMPQMSGKQFIQSLDEMNPETRVLFMSGYTDSAIDHHGILDPDTKFIQKPFTPVDLLKKVREVLDG